MRNFVRSFAVVSLAICGSALLPICCDAFAQEAQVVDGIAAIVNGDVITYSQVRALSASNAPASMFRFWHASHQFSTRI